MINKVYTAIAILAFIIISAISAWRVLALQPAYAQPAAWLLWLGLTLAFGLFWLILGYSLVRFWPPNHDGGLRQRLLTAFLVGLIGGLVAFLLTTPAGLSRLTLELYADNVWSPDIFRLTWLRDSLEEAPFSLPSDEAVPVALEIVAGGQPQATAATSSPLEPATPPEVWFIKATWPDGSNIPLKAFTAEPGWRRRRVTWNDQPQSVWVAQSQRPTRLSWQGQATGPLTLLFAKHDRAGLVTLRWQGTEQTVDLFSPNLTFTAITLPAQQPVVWRAKLPLSALQAEEISLAITPDPDGHYGAALQKLRLVGLPGRTIELAGAELLKALQVKDGQAVLTPEGIQFVPEDPEEPPQIYLADAKGDNSIKDLAGSEDWLKLIPPLENALWVLYVICLGFVLMAALTRFFQPRVLANLNKAVLSVLIILFIAEVGPRLYLPAPGHYYARQPNLRSLFKPAPEVMPGIEGESHLIINSQGIRGDEFSPADGYRILAIGASTTECLYLDQTEAWPYLVQTGLNQSLTDQGMQVWVGNIGKSARKTYDHIVQLKYLLPQYRDLDAVILLLGASDLFLTLRYGDAPNNPYRSTTPGAQQATLERAFDVVAEQKSDTPFYQQTTTWRIIGQVLRAQARVGNPEEIEVEDEFGHVYVERRLKRKNAQIIEDLPDYLAVGLAEYTQNVHRIIDQAQAHQVRVILMTQPMLWRADLTQAEKDLLWLGQGPGREYFYSPAALDRAMTMYNQKLLDICAERQVECIDLAAVIPKTTDIFYDDAHFTEEGARQVADVVKNYLLSQPPFGSD